jgi:cell division transport system permease protein
MIGRILINTKKQISRSGWAGWASISVMTLAFLVACIFGGIAYFSNLWIQYIESRSNLVVFFDVGMDQDIIDQMRAKWAQNPEIKDISFTSEEDAFNEFGDYAQRSQPIQYEALQSNSTIQGRLPSSLDIQIYSLDTLASVQTYLETDVNAQNQELLVVDTDGEESVPTYEFATDPEVPPITLKVDSERLDELREIFTILRFAGIVIITLLFVVIFFFTLMTVEFRLYNQMEEIGVMQLVGGSLLFIRMPYILEGGFYGLIGSLVATFVLGVVLVSVFVGNLNPTLTKFFYDNFFKLPWPSVTALGWTAIIGVIALAGFLLGSVSTWISIRRYIR